MVTQQHLTGEVGMVLLVVMVFTWVPGTHLYEGELGSHHLPRQVYDQESNPPISSSESRIIINPMDHNNQSIHNYFGHSISIINEQWNTLVIYIERER